MLVPPTNDSPHYPVLLIVTNDDSFIETHVPSDNQDFVNAFIILYGLFRASLNLSGTSDGISYALGFQVSGTGVSGDPWMR